MSTGHTALFYLLRFGFLPFYSFIFLPFYLLRQVVYSILHPLSPLLRRAATVECLPWYRLAYMYGKMLAHIAIHLVHKEYHGKIER